MSGVRDGGAAFPIPDVRDESGCGLVQGYMGLSKREWFATHAPDAPWQWYQDRPSQPTDFTDEGTKAANVADMNWQIERDVAWRWHYADAMLTAGEAQ